MAYTVPVSASWIQGLPENIYTDETFIRIIDFYLVHCPVGNRSARGRDLATDYHWSDPWNKPWYLNRQLKEASTASTERKLVFSATSMEKKTKGKTDSIQSTTQNKESKSQTKSVTMDEALVQAGLETFPQYMQEKICILDKEDNHYMSTFAHIRNSFAHCRFNICVFEGKRVYCLEDVIPVSKKSGDAKVTARIVLFESTLLKWIDLVEGGEQLYKPEE